MTNWEIFGEEGSANQEPKPDDSLLKQVAVHMRQKLGYETHFNKNRDICFITPGGQMMMVSVRKDSLIEVWGMISISANRKDKAHEFIDFMSGKMGPIKYMILDTVLYRMRILVADPFVPEHLEYALNRDVDAFVKEVELFHAWKEHGYES